MRRVLSIVLIASLIGGCGGSSTGTGSSNGGSGDLRLLSTLSKNEFSELCRGIEKSVKENINPVGFCNFAGVLGTLFFGSVSGQVAVNECNELSQECISDFETGTNLEYQCPLTTHEEALKCQATIEQIDACVSDTYDQLNEFLAPLKCELLLSDPTVVITPDNVNLAQGQDVPNTPACNLVKEKCPLIFKNANEADRAALHEKELARQKAEIEQLSNQD